MSKSYSKGYSQGYDDAINNRSKVNPREFWEGLKNALNPFGSIDEYIKGYEEGYRIGTRDRERRKRGN